MPDNNGDIPAFAALADGRHGDPFAVLGCHKAAGGFVIRALAPGAKAITVIARETGTTLGTLAPHGDGVVFEGRLDHRYPYRLKIDWGAATQITEDPYSFPPLLGELDLYLLAEGRHRDLATCLGARLMEVGGVPGVRFAVWAPNAQRVSVVGDFNLWDGRRHPMRLRPQAGVWELFIPRLEPGTIYKYEILGSQGILPLKADPVARQIEMPPATASIVADPAAIPRHSAPLRDSKSPRDDEALAIYEVHATSWMRHYDGLPYSWDELAARLIPYVTDLGFTHIEFLPVMGHPFGGSWGYQPLSQFAPMPEHGSPQDFARFVDRCHEAGLGVILDWVPAHFPTDTHGLVRFDGTALYEHADPREGFHQDWNTLIYNHGRNEVRGFLIASALFWLEHFGVDGLRVDAVASMLYRDYSRPVGQWIPNARGGRENLEAISFLQELSRAIAERCPGALLIAEESTAWPGVSKPTDQGGLGFTHKWNMGWMHDTLHYMQEDPINRRYHHDQMTFSLVYAFSEHFVLPISHDEVVHGKRSLLGRMPGDDWQRFANLRAYLGFMWTHPGKKLLFMGSEFGQPTEWNHDGEVSWHLLQHHAHRGVQSMMRDLNTIYRREPALHQRDFDPGGFRWVIGDDREQSIFAYLRFGHDGTAPALVVCNLTPVPRHNYALGVPGAKTWREIFNSDEAVYGGSNVGNRGALAVSGTGLHGLPASIALTLPPLAAIILQPVP
jgi:1,4-alpha-glucan branching enzyme